ncbi:hypothetical protein [Amphibacillus jilinensis]|uniref:hypothetical protein n=1 Tax=Amphibacillus jilinensis TaxID=1216008 RepID=UPI0002F230AD|nr:hypothetical protein [Amphibacillus jilinensis]
MADEADAFTLTSLSGNFVKRDDDGLIREIMYISEKYYGIAHIDPHNNYSTGRFTIAKILDQSIDDNIIYLETILIGDVTLRNLEAPIEHSIKLTFESFDDNRQVKLNDSTEAFEAITYKVMQAEHPELFNPEEYFHNLYNMELIPYLNEYGYDG